MSIKYRAIAVHDQKYYDFTYIFDFDDAEGLMIALNNAHDLNIDLAIVDYATINEDLTMQNIDGTHWNGQHWIITRI